MKTIDELLRKVTELGASDLHIKVGSPPMIRMDGELESLDAPSCTPDDTKDYAASLMSEKQIRRFSETNEIDFAYSAPQVGRYRVNVYRQRGTISIAMRQVVTRVPDFAELNLPPIVQKLALEPRGMVLVTGTTGSGKTTTLAAMIDHINRQSAQAHRHGRGSHRDPASRPALHRQPARGRSRHRELRHGAQVRAAPGPRHHLHR